MSNVTRLEKRRRETIYACPSFAAYVDLFPPPSPIKYQLGFRRSLTIEKRYALG
jgi:hypothetical protein